MIVGLFCGNFGAFLLFQERDCLLVRRRDGLARGVGFIDLAAVRFWLKRFVCIAIRRNSDNRK